MGDLIGAFAGLGAGIALCLLPPLLVIGVVIFFVSRRRQRSSSDRLEQLEAQLQSEWRPGPADADAARSNDRSAREKVYERLDNALASRGFAGRVRAQLRKANLALTVTEYLMLHVILGLGVSVVLYIFMPDARAALGLIAGIFGPRLYVTFRQKQRLKAFNNQLVDILGLWVNALKAGFSVPQALEAVGREAPAPASEEFRRVVAEISIGIPFETALNNMLSRVDSEDLDLVFTAVNIQREVGGNLAEILEVISFTIRERIRIKGEIQVLTSSGRATGTVISLLPVFLAIFLLFVNPTYMGQLFYGPPIGAYLPVINIPCGWPLVAAGLVLIAIGMAVIRRIVDVQI